MKNTILTHIIPPDILRKPRRARAPLLEIASASDMPEAPGIPPDVVKCVENTRNRVSDILAPCTEEPR